MKNNLVLIFAIMVFGGIFGFIYETIFYYFDLGYLVKRGTTFGPWIPIYSYGSLLINISADKFKNKKYKVFIISMFVCGILEFIIGYLLFHVGNTRLWNYNTEIFNFGNIGGYICLRSVVFFGISGLFLIYIVKPFLENFQKYKYFKFITITLFILFIFDIILYQIINNLHFSTFF